MERLKNFCEDLFFFFFWRALALCVLGPWPRAFLSLASRVSVLGKAVLGLGFFCVLGLEPCVLDSTSGVKSRAHDFTGLSRMINESSYDHVISRVYHVPSTSSIISKRISSRVGCGDASTTANSRILWQTIFQMVEISFFIYLL